LTKPIKTKETLDEVFKRIDTFIRPRTRRLLIGEHVEETRNYIVDLLKGDDVELIPLASGAEVVAAIKQGGYDAVVLDLDLPEMKGFELIDELHGLSEAKELPVLVYSNRMLSKKEELALKRLGQTMALKDVRSPQRLLDEASLFLHRPFASMTDAQRDMIGELHQDGTVLAGKKVLIVDDDIRNIFAMTSLLEPYKMHAVSAETGKSAIEILQENNDIDVVLMDIMMPDMDGYDTMRAIRKLAKFRSLPIIALTAKAMKGDREKCIEAGASDYIAKPVDTEQLLSMLRIWLYR